MKDLIIIGSGGLGREVAWLVERINGNKAEWNILGFIDDDKTLTGKEIGGYKVLGGVDAADRYKDAYFVCAVAAAKVREKIISRLRTALPDVKFATVIDPSVQMSERVTIGEGSIICLGTTMTVDIVLGEHTIVNPCCTIGHDAVLDDFVTLYPGVNVSGTVRLEKCTEIGTGTQIIQGKSVGEYTIVGAGSVVIRDIPPKCTAVGVPARPIKFSE